MESAYSCKKYKILSKLLWNWIYSKLKDLYMDGRPSEDFFFEIWRTQLNIELQANY